MAVPGSRLARSRQLSPAHGIAGHPVATIIETMVTPVWPGAGRNAPLDRTPLIVSTRHAGEQGVSIARDDAGSPYLIGPPPDPPSGGEACAVLIGGAAALSLLFERTGAEDAPSRAAVLVSPDFHVQIKRIMDTSPAYTFDVALPGLHPFWLTAAVAILEHATLASANPRPGMIGGFPFDEVLVAARRLAAGTPPFDRVVPCIDQVIRKEQCHHAG